MTDEKFIEEYQFYVINHKFMEIVNDLVELIAVAKKKYEIDVEGHIKENYGKFGDEVLRLANHVIDEEGNLDEKELYFAIYKTWYGKGVEYHANSLVYEWEEKKHLIEKYNEKYSINIINNVEE